MITKADISLDNLPIEDLLQQLIIRWDGKDTKPSSYQLAAISDEIVVSPNSTHYINLVDVLARLTKQELIQFYIRLVNNRDAYELQKQKGTNDGTED